VRKNTKTLKHLRNYEKSTRRI